MHRNPEMYTYRVTLTSTSTLFNKNIDYNRLARKIGIANQVDQLKEKESERKGKEGNYFKLHKIY